jgi:hypothetical protein
MVSAQWNSAAPMNPCGRIKPPKHTSENKNIALTHNGIERFLTQFLSLFAFSSYLRVSNFHDNQFHLAAASWWSFG